jgi:ATP-dependent helicase/nuclease subunit B
MALQLILGSSGSGKSYRLYKKMISESMEKPENNYLIIVPEQFTLQTQKDIVTMHPNHGTMNIDILSFMRLAYRVFDEVGGNDIPVLEDTGKSMVLRKIITKHKKELELFQHDVQKQGFINELKSLISEIFQYSITEDKLKEMEALAANRPMLQSKLHDIIIIYQGFKDFLREKYITAEEILDVLCQVIDKSELISGSVVCLDGFTGFTPAQYQLLTILMKKAKQVLITVTIDPREDITQADEEYKLFHLSKKTISRLMTIAEEEGIKIDKPFYAENEMQVPFRYRNSKALAALEHNIFRYPIKCYEAEQENISIHAARDRKQEVQFVVREIKHLIREEQYRYKDIAVVTGDIGNYGRLLGQEFDKAGIPCFIDHKRDLMANPFIEFLRSALDIIKKDFDYESVFRYLRSGMAEVCQEDVDILENYIIALGIRGHKRWQTEWTRVYRGQKEGELTRINEIREQIIGELMPLYEILTDSGKTVMEYTTALYEFGQKAEAAGKLEVFQNAFEEQKMLSTAKEYGQVYGIVLELYDKLVELLGEEKLSIREYMEVLEAGLTEAKVGLIPPGLDQVVVGDIERTRLKDIKALFFVGVNDGIIPSGKAGGGLLSDMERQMLAEHKIEMAPTKRQAAYTEQFYLYLNLTKPQEKLYVTYSKLGEDGKSLRPSYLIGTLLKLFSRLTVIDEEETKEDLEHILGCNRGIDYLIEGLRRYPYEEVPDTWMELFRYYTSREDYSSIIKNLIEAVFYINEERGLSKQVSHELYGKVLMGSVTRFERYAACAFAHYISYGLELKERQEYKLAVPDMGNIFHNAIEAFSRKLGESEYDWHTIPEDVRDSFAAECVREAAEGYGNAIFSSSKRYEYMIKRVERITKRTLWALCQHIRKGDFEPAAFELAFSDKTKLDSLSIKLSEEESIRLQGRIDRLDLYEEEDKVLVKVIDYKSGNTAFDLLSVYYGLQLQLAVYMNAAMELMEQEYPGKEIIPAAILYYNIDDPLVEKSDHVEESILKELKMNGVVNSNTEVIKHLDNSFGGDGQEIRAGVKSDVIPVETGKDGYPTKRSNVAELSQLTALEGLVTEHVTKLGKNILDGIADIKPYQMGKKNACEYCPYGSICGFDTRIPGNNYRNLRALSKDEVWKEIMNQNERKMRETEGIDQEGNDRTTEQADEAESYHQIGGQSERNREITQSDTDVSMKQEEET